MVRDNHNQVHKDGACGNTPVSIAELLPIGKTNAIKTNDLVKYFNGISVRKLRERISYERKKGQIICSTKENGGGYYLTGNKAELREFVEWASQEAKSLQEAIKSAVKALEILDEQQELSDMNGNHDLTKHFKESEMGGK